MPKVRGPCFSEYIGFVERDCAFHLFKGIRYCEDDRYNIATSSGTLCYAVEQFPRVNLTIELSTLKVGFFNAHDFPVLIIRDGNIMLIVQE